jgi:hypothetical protein
VNRCATQLTELRLSLESARVAIGGRVDVEARVLRQALGESICAIALLESAVDDDLGAGAAHATMVGHGLVARVRAYCDAQRPPLRFVVATTPFPREDTQRLSREEIRAAIERMPPGASSPPAALVPELVEAQLATGGSLPPSAPTGPMPPSPAIPSFDDDE